MAKTDTKNTRTQRTSTGVLLDVSDAAEAPQSSRAQKKRRANRQQKRRRQVAANALSVTVILLGAVLFSSFFGDAILEPQSEPTVLSLPTPAVTMPVEERAIPRTPATDAPPTKADAAFAVFIPSSGSRYHMTATCSGMKSATEVTLKEATLQGLTPCARCKPPVLDEPAGGQ